MLYIYIYCNLNLEECRKKLDYENLSIFVIIAVYDNQLLPIEKIEQTQKWSFYCLNHHELVLLYNI